MSNSLPVYPTDLNSSSMWTSSVEVPERATLTLLKGNQFVLGCPKDAWDSMRSEAIDAIKRWLSGEAAGAVLPWPTDVVDLR